MRNIPGNKGNIPGFERNNLPGKVHFPTVAFTNADFQAVVEMQYTGRYIGNAPFLTSNDPEREVGRKLITPVLNDRFAVAAHGESLPSFVCVTLLYHEKISGDICFILLIMCKNALLEL